VTSVRTPVVPGCSSDPAPTGTVAHVERFEHLLPSGGGHPSTEETHP
jgi:hypothetical protein